MTDGVRVEFGSVVLSESGAEKSATLRRRFSELLTEVETLTSGPSGGRETALARTHLQEAHGWAQRAVALSVINQAVKAFVAVLAVAAALVAAPAWAQDAAAPSVQAEHWMQALLGFVFTGLLFPLGKKLVDWLTVQSQGKAYANAVKAVTDLIEAQAVWLHEKLREAAADGVITRAEVEAIATELVAKLPAATVAALRGHIGEGVVGWVAGMLRDRVTARSRAEGAAAAALATVPDAATAKTHPMWTGATP